MKSRGKPNARRNDDEPIIQLTRNQMVVAVCVLLGGALFFYLLGVITMRIEPMLTGTHAHEGTPQIRPAPEARPPAPRVRETAAGPEGTQRSPRTDILPEAPEPSRAPTARAERGRAADAPPLTRLPAPEPETREERAATSPADVRSEPLDAPAPRTVPGAPGPRPVALPSAPDPEAPAAVPEKPETEETPAAEEPAEEPSEPSESESAPALDRIELPPDSIPVLSEGAPFYSIQLIAFSRRNRNRAEAYAREVRESAGLDVELEESSDGELVRVFVGRYADRETALRACRELQKQQQFSNVFVPQTPRGGSS